MNNTLPPHWQRYEEEKDSSTTFSFEVSFESNRTKTVFVYFNFR